MAVVEGEQGFKFKIKLNRGVMSQLWLLLIVGFLGILQGRLIRSKYRDYNRTTKLQENTVEFKLLGGQIVSSGDYDFVVQIIHIRGKINGEPDITVCTGAIITLRHIITAASCLDFNENGLKEISVDEFKIYGGANCLYIAFEDSELHDNIPRYECPEKDENAQTVASIKPVAVIVPMSSVINNVASIRGVPFYMPFSDIAIFEVEPLDELAQELNAKINDEYGDEVSFNWACIPDTVIGNDGAVHIIASYGRRKNLLYQQAGNPINVKLNLILENNVYIDMCPASIPQQACSRLMIIEGEQSTAEGDGGAAVIKRLHKLPVLMGILSVRQDIGRAYTKFMFATQLSEFHDFFCYYIGLCIYNEFREKEYWKHPEEVIFLEHKAGNGTLGNGMSSPYR
uniref:Peptidase S1 domain-containing protein n=1 Tax=Setaria digitata TaxID=48799 RepID=A0A915PJ02_9BILA